MKLSAMTRSLLLAAGMICLTACELPPRQAWRVIQTEGLIPYLGIEFGPRPVPAYARQPAVRQGPRSLAAAYAPSASSIPVANRFLGVGGGNSAFPEKKLAVPGVYVVRTQPPAARPVAPAAAPAKPQTVAAKPVKTITLSAPKAAIPKPAPPAESKPTGQPPAGEIAKAPAAKPAPSPPKPASAAAATPAKPVRAGDAIPVPNPRTQPQTASKDSAPKPPPTSDSGKADSLPFGTPVPGRPGLVNSPYAGKYQLVDVTGLNIGQEIKCPYSGKLFRVPPAVQASNTIKSVPELPQEETKEKE